MKSRALLAGLSLFLMVAPSSAHHTITSVFDLTKTVSFTGTVTQVFFANPHVYVVVNVANPRNGTAQEWTLELPAPNALLKNGMNSKSIKVQDVLQMTGYLAKAGIDLSHVRQGSGTFNVPTPLNLLCAVETTLPNGAKITMDEESQHHSFANQYAGTNKQTLTGTLDNIIWASPRSSVILLVRSSNGRDLESWTVEFPSANVMAAKGLTKDSVKPGDRVIVTGATGRNVPHTLLMQTATFPNGVTLTP